MQSNIKNVQHRNHKIIQKISIKNLVGNMVRNPYKNEWVWWVFKFIEVYSSLSWNHFNEIQGQNSLFFVFMHKNHGQTQCTAVAMIHTIRCFL